jgi:hypothetical protein
MSGDKTPQSPKKPDLRKRWTHYWCPSCGEGTPERPKVAGVTQKEYIKRCKDKSVSIVASTVSKKVTTGDWWLTHDDKVLWCDDCQEKTAAGMHYPEYPAEFNPTETEKKQLWEWTCALLSNLYALPVPDSQKIMQDNLSEGERGIFRVATEVCEVMLERAKELKEMPTRDQAELAARFKIERAFPKLGSEASRRKSNIQNVYAYARQRREGGRKATQGTGRPGDPRRSPPRRPR